VTPQARILGVTLARGGSKEVPRKNIRPVLGHPLIAYTIAEALRCERITRYIVSSDDDEIREIAQDYGAEAPFRRPPELAADAATSEAAMKQAVIWAEEDEGKPFDYVVELMATGPLKTVEDINGVLDKLLETGADSVVSVVNLGGHHPARAKKIMDDRLVAFCMEEPVGMRRQDLRPEAFLRNSSIYAMKRSVAVEMGLRYNPADVRPYVMPHERSVGIDSEVELALVEVLLARAPRPYVRRVRERGA
jgi:CMP-N-acetylneuraminic acid synthetase